MIPERGKTGIHTVFCLLGQPQQHPSRVQCKTSQPKAAPQQAGLSVETPVPLLMLHPSKCSRPGWNNPEQPDLGEGALAHGRGLVGTR